MTTSTTNWSTVVKDGRTRRGWTQAQLAVYLGVSSASVGSWERGRHAPDSGYHEKLTALAGGARPRLPRSKPAATAAAKVGATKVKPRQGPDPDSNGQTNGHQLEGMNTRPAETDTDFVHNAIMGDASLTSAQRSAVLGVRIMFVEMNRHNAR